MTPFISLCMIVKNEEKVLGRCLESVKDHIDEIIIVDTGSEDRTREIAREYTTNIFDYHWDNNFSEARNFAASKATGEWILVLDADEYVDPVNLADAITEIKNNKNAFEVYAVNIINFAGKNGESIAQHRHVRIYRNNNNIEFFRTIHEQLRKKDNSPVRLGLSSLMVYHSGYLAKTVKEKKKNSRNLVLVEQELLKDGKAFDFFNLGNELRLLGKTEEALNAYIKAYQKKEGFWMDWIPFCLCNMVECLINLNRYSDALAVIEDAAQIFNNTADFIYLRGHIYLAQNRYEDAKKVFMNIISNSNRYHSVIKSPDYRDYLPNKRLGFIYEQERDYENAVRYFIRALNYNKYCLESAVRVIKILSKFHSETEIYNFFSENIFTDNKEFIHKILIFTLNQGLTEFATLLLNNYYSENELMKYLIKLKIDIIKGNYNVYMYDEKIESESLLWGLNSSIIDTADLYILYCNMDKCENRRYLEVIINNSNLSSILGIINYENEEHTPIDVDGYIYLIEKCIVFQKFDLLKKLIELKDSIEIDVNARIASVFYNKGYEDESIEFYQLANEESLEKNDYIQIIDWLIAKKNFQEAYRISLNCINKYKDDFRFHKYIIVLLEQEGKSAGKEILNALRIFKDSEWLDLKLLSI